MAVNRAKLRDLSGEQLSALAKTDELELLYLHLYSMRNFADVKDRLIGALPAEAEVPSAVADEAPAAKPAGGKSRAKPPVSSS